MGYHHRWLSLQPVSMPRAGARGCAPVDGKIVRIGVFSSQCPVLGREGVHQARSETRESQEAKSLNAPCWGARVCTGPPSSLIQIPPDFVSMPRAGARGCAPRGARRDRRRVALVSMPRAGARGCAPSEAECKTIEARLGLNAPCWGARVCTRGPPARTSTSCSPSQCPVLGREGVHRCYNCGWGEVDVQSQCPVLGREGVHLVLRLLGDLGGRLSQCPVLGREGVHRRLVT